jgi:nucleotide-binding universal stress UspA family protein
MMDDAQHITAPAGGGDTRMNILFATDLHEPADVTDYVQKLSESLSADLYVLHVHVPTTSTPLAVDPLSGFGEIAYTMYDPTTAQYLEEADNTAFQSFLAERFSSPVRPAILEGDPAQIILSNAADVKADLIVLSKRRHSAVARMLLGSVTNVVARESRQPVLLLPID